MPTYRCLMRGENFPGRLLGESKPVGFLTTRFVEAQSPQEAESLALALLRGDETLAVPTEFRSKDAEVFFEAIDEVQSGTNSPSQGFSFFVMGT